MDNQLKKLKMSTFSQLAKKDLSKIKKFISHCKEEDGYEPIFYWGNIEKRKNACINDLIYYNETGDIIGYLALYHFEENEVEITLMTHPIYRSFAFYKRLLTQMKQIISEYPIDIKNYVFTCNQSFLSLKEYLKNLGAYCFQLTHKLILTPRSFQHLKKNNRLDNIPALQIRKANHADIFSLMHLEADCFQVCREAYKEQVYQNLQDPSKGMMVLVKNQEVIGKVQIYFEKQKAYLYGLGIETHEQGRGYGSAFLFNVIKTLFAQGIKKIILDVEEMAHIKWYEKFNFKLLAVYEHWRLSAYKNPIKERDKQLENLLLNFHCYQVQHQLANTLYKH